jgi:hypothetical protein
MLAFLLLSLFTVSFAFINQRQTTYGCSVPIEMLSSTSNTEKIMASSNSDDVRRLSIGNLLVSHLHHLLGNNNRLHLILASQSPHRKEILN